MLGLLHVYTVTTGNECGSTLKEGTYVSVGINVTYMNVYVNDIVCMDLHVYKHVCAYESHYINVCGSVYQNNSEQTK